MKSCVKFSITRRGRRFHRMAAAGLDPEVREGDPQRIAHTTAPFRHFHQSVILSECSLTNPLQKIWKF